MKKIEYPITCSCIGTNRCLTRPAFFRLVEDATLADCEELGIGIEKTNDAGILWVFTRVYVEFYRYPTYKEKVTLVTKAGPRMSFAYPRHIEMLDEEGNRIANMSSLWVLLDESSRKAILKPPLVAPDHRNGNELELPGKVQRKEAKPIATRMVRFSDIDLNRHLNNTRYIEIIDDALGREFLSTHEIASMLINYDSEIREGECIEILASEDRTYLCGMVAGRYCFQVELSYRKTFK